MESSDGTRYWYKEGALVQAPDQMPAAGAKVTSTTAAAGLVVKRGADWKWGDQDGDGLGVLEKPHDTAHWWRVQWASGTSNVYRVGAEGAHDLQFADFEAPAPPGRPRPGEHVLLSLDYKEQGDAASGPLVPGRAGKLLEDDGSDLPFKARAQRTHLADDNACATVLPMLHRCVAACWLHGSAQRRSHDILNVSSEAHAPAAPILFPQVCCCRWTPVAPTTGTERAPSSRRRPRCPRPATR